MFVTDAIAAGSEYVPESSRNDRTKLIQESVATFCIGEHGTEFKPDPLVPADVEAILDCGHRLHFPVAPVTGEELYCYRCDSWEKCVVPGGYLVKCESCEMEESHFGHNSTLALARARTHGFGKGNRRRTIPHTVLVGRYTETSINWQQYEKGMQ